MTEITHILAVPLPPWALMWLLALALYAAAKTATLANANLTLPRKLAYLLLSPGMNPNLLFRRAQSKTLHAAPFLTNILLGAALLWGLARILPIPLLQAWIGMIGLVLILHFGLLQLLALAWQSAGFHATALMRQPLRSASLAEFWGLRWNTAFRQLAHQFLFQPLAKRTSPKIAFLLAFAASGLIHDLVISLPARAGYGLPTAYFLLQGLALLFERSPLGKHLLRHRLAGRAFALAVPSLPAPLLFHAPFITRVFLPFMVACHALPPETLR